mmetsp:Transcript_57849/g.113877  ORF Transcript_57849/g.113877 Transcript_57849/m.113877 type:complete len:315 (-) Transcript_57849:239-1183(-)
MRGTRPLRRISSDASGDTNDKFTRSLRDFSWIDALASNLDMTVSMCGIPPMWLSSLACSSELRLRLISRFSACSTADSDARTSISVPIASFRVSSWLRGEVDPKLPNPLSTAILAASASDTTCLPPPLLLLPLLLLPSAGGAVVVAGGRLLLLLLLLRAPLVRKIHSGSMTGLPLTSSLPPTCRCAASSVAALRFRVTSNRRGGTRGGDGDDEDGRSGSGADKASTATKDGTTPRLSIRTAAAVRTSSKDCALYAASRRAWTACLVAKSASASMSSSSASTTSPTSSDRSLPKLSETTSAPTWSSRRALWRVAG